MDSQSFLGHKPKLSDYRIIKMVDYQWRKKIRKFDKSKRILFGLQLFPEASIDYWIDDVELIKHEEMLFEAPLPEGLQTILQKWRTYIQGRRDE